MLHMSNKDQLPERRSVVWDPALLLYQTLLPDSHPWATYVPAAVAIINVLMVRESRSCLRPLSLNTGRAPGHGFPGQGPPSTYDSLFPAHPGLEL